MNVSAFIEFVVAAAQSPNHHWHDDQWYSSFNFNESVRCQSFNFKLNLKLPQRLPLRGLHTGSECVCI